MHLPMHLPTHLQTRRPARPPSTTRPARRFPLVALAPCLCLGLIGLSGLPGSSALSAPLEAAPAEAPASGGPVASAIAEGDRAWARRGQGAQRVEGRYRAQVSKAGSEAVATAVAAYERALRADPGSAEARWKLLRVLFFQGEFVARSSEDKQRIFGRGKELVEDGIDRLAASVGGREALDELMDRSPEAAAARLEKAGQADAAAPLFFWGSTHWGLWAEAYGAMAAAREGVGPKIRDYARIAIALDGSLEDGGPHRVLGRLHALAPKIPFFTGWVDRDKAVAELERAYRLAPEEPFNGVYLGEVLLQERPDQKARAHRLLNQVLERPERPGYEVEEILARNLARHFLAGKGARR